MSESNIPNLRAELRTRTGKGAARQARRNGLVPGIVYGGGQNPIPINLNFNGLIKRLRAGRFLSTLYNLQIEGVDDSRVICRSVQRDVVKDLPTHVDFMRLQRTSKINLFIPITFVNNELSPGLKRGGVLTVVRGEVELIVTASDIPNEITADLTGLDVGDVITISSVEIPAGCKPTITDRDFVIANISAPSGLKSSDQEVVSDEQEVSEEEAEKE
ncbi:MAG: 50S ribosomal protein L25/general stress protein Ctc [Rhodobacteraceae bacterium]|nr:50S ribosomal protein L25/general stress protein Ctc [Paracoccaceae bacterium]